MAILCYHSVDPKWSSPLAVTPGEFERHCVWLARRGVVPLEVAVKRSPGSAPVALTFDDGFAELFDHAFPVLVRFGLPATLFVVGRTLTDPPIPVDWVDDPPARPLRTLTSEQVLEMRDVGIAFGSHSASHRDLATLGEEEVVRDLRESRETLEDLLRTPVAFVAYPRGRHNEHVRRAAHRAGFSHGFSLPEHREPTGPYAVPRVGVYRGNGVRTLWLKCRPQYLRLRTSPMYSTVRRVAGRPGPRRSRE